MIRSGSLLLTGFLILFGATACQSPSVPSLRESVLGPRCAGELHSLTGLPDALLWRERVWADRGDGSSDLLDLVIEKRAERLVLIGMSPIGAKLFSVVQEAGEATRDGLPIAVLPAHPLDILEAAQLRLRNPEASAYSLDRCQLIDPEHSPPNESRLRFETLERR